MKLKGLSEFNRGMDKMLKRVEKNAKKLNEDAIDEGYKSARRGVPVDTGELRNSITKEKDKLYATADHAEIVEYGSVNQNATLFMEKAREDMKKHIEKNIGGVMDDR